MRVTFGLVAALSILGGAEACGGPAHERRTPHIPHEPRNHVAAMHNAARAHQERHGQNIVHNNHLEKRATPTITSTTSCKTVANQRTCSGVTGTVASSCSTAFFFPICTSSVVSVPVSTSTNCIGGGILQFCSTTLVPSPTAPVTPTITSTTSCKGIIIKTSCTTATGIMTTSCSGSGFLMTCKSSIVPPTTAAPTSTVPPTTSAAPTTSIPPSTVPSTTAPPTTSVPVPSNSTTAVPTTSVPVPSNGTTTGVPSSTTTAPPVTNTTAPVVVKPIGGASVDSKVLILGITDDDLQAGYHGLKGYGIPYDAIIVPASGFSLPVLNDTATHGRYGGIITLNGLAVETPNGWASALSADQWTAIENYQVMFGVRLVRINEFPGDAFGTQDITGTSEDQPISLTDTSDFPTANLKTNAPLSAAGLYHYPATITNSSIAKVVATFAASGQNYVAAVINKFDNGREQFVWFTGWAPQWSTTCAALQHAHIHWMTRGLFLGKRKTYLNVQIDDLELETDMYLPNGSVFRVRPADLDGHVAWQKDLNSRLPAGSDFRLELGHNGNGDIIVATNPTSNGACFPDYAVDYPEIIDTPLEFQKPLGTGTNMWPPEWTKYPWSAACTRRDALTAWYLDTTKRDAFFHVSHTFTHEEMNNATYHDANLEIQFNQAWLAQTGIAAGKFSANGIIPPAITGLHNGDVIKAWMDNGIKHVVGDNTRPVLMASDPYHPLISTVAANGYDGLVIVPRWATSIYYNCDTWDCDVQEWKDISKGYGTYVDLLENAKTVNSPYLFALKADPYMFHQANLRLIDMPVITAGTQTRQMSMVMGWVESVAGEVNRVTNWPIISIKHDDFAQYFIDRMNLDACQPSMSFTLNADATAIVQVTVSAQNANCGPMVPVTIPTGSATGANSMDKVGAEPPIAWVKLNGGPVTLQLNPPVSVV